LQKSLSYPGHLQKRKNPLFFCTGLPIGLHRKSYRIAYRIPTGYTEIVYKIGREEFQRGKHEGWPQQTL